MLLNIEKLIKLVYRQWKEDSPPIEARHPDEEVLACFLENRLSPEENEEIKTHLIICDTCSQGVSAQLALKPIEEKELPLELIERLKELVPTQEEGHILEIFLRLKERLLEILSTTGDVLVAGEFVPVPVLRSRKVKDFKDEVTIVKDFKDIRVEAKIENKQGRSFNLTIVARNKATQEVMKDLRVSLIKGDLEMESYLADTGRVTFEHVLLGKY